MTQIKKSARVVGGLHGAALRAKLTLEKTNPDKFDSWCMSLTGEERLELVDELTLIDLKSRGIKNVPKIKRIARIVKAPWICDKKK